MTAKRTVVELKLDLNRAQGLLPLQVPRVLEHFVLLSKLIHLLLDRLRIGGHRGHG